MPIQQICKHKHYHNYGIYIRERKRSFLSYCGVIIVSLITRLYGQPKACYDMMQYYYIVFIEISCVCRSVSCTRALETIVLTIVLTKNSPSLQICHHQCTTNAFITLSVVPLLLILVFSFGSADVHYLLDYDMSILGQSLTGIYFIY